KSSHRLSPLKILGAELERSFNHRRRFLSFFGSLSSLKRLRKCENIHGQSGHGCEYSTQPNDVNGRRSSQGWLRKGMHTQMLSFEDSSIRDAVFPERSLTLAEFPTSCEAAIRNARGCPPSSRARTSRFPVTSGASLRIN